MWTWPPFKTRLAISVPHKEKDYALYDGKGSLEALNRAHKVGIGFAAMVQSDPSLLLI